MTTTTSPDAPAAEAMGAEPDERLEELRFLMRTGRLRMWLRPVAETLVRAGLGGGYTTAEWAETPWYGPIEPWLHEERYSDILINGPGQEIVVVDAGQRMPTGVALHAEWVAFVQRQLLLRSSLVAPEAPETWPSHGLIGTADWRLRFAVTRPPATPDGPTLALRLLPRRWRTLDDLVNQELGVLPRAAAELLLEALRHGVTVLIAGGTGSGKTTLTAALLQAIGAERRVVIIEEARELPVLGDSVTMEVLRSGMSFAECVRFSLRQRPDLIVVGEVRGPEALAMLQAAATGHPGIGTIHAPDVQAALKNLERMACEGNSVPPSIVRGLLTSSAVPLLVAHIGRYGGRRRVGQIDEVIPMGAAGQSGDKYATNPLFAFNPSTGQVEQRGIVNAEWGR